MKKLSRYSILILFFLLLFTKNAIAAGNIGINNGKNIKQNIRIYYTSDLKTIGYNVDGEKYNSINSSDKEKITTKLEAYFYKEGIKPIDRIEDVSTTNSFYNPKDKGFYLIVLDKANYEDKILVSKPVLIYFDGNDQMINVKSELIKMESLTEMEVVLEWENGKVLANRVRIGIYNSEGNLVDEVWLSKDNNWRHIFKNLDPLTHYAVWETHIDNIFFTIKRVGNIFYITNILMDDDLPDIYIPDNVYPDGLHPDGEYPDSIYPDNVYPDKKPDTLNPAIDENIKDTTSKDNINKDNLNNENINKDNKSNNENAYKVDDKKGFEDENSDKLPQTGLLWWPLPVFLGLGIFFFILSFRYKDE